MLAERGRKGPCPPSPAAGAAPPLSPLMSSLYETPRLVDEYLLFHYGRDHEILPWDHGPREALRFPVRTVSELQPAGTVRRALDIGCAVGRSAFELSKTCHGVNAMDFSRAFISAARTLQEQHRVSYQITEEGHVLRPLEAVLPAGIHPERVTFQEGDAMNLPPDLGTFDLVHAANLICRLTEPRRFLDRLASLVHPDGHLLLTTPCTWLEEFTPPERWPQGGTLDWLKEILTPHFTLTRTRNLPFLIREHARKFQWSMALGTVWRRKA